MLGWRDVPVAPAAPGPGGARGAAGLPPDLHRPAARGAQRLGAHALRHPQARREPHPRARRGPGGPLPRREPVDRDDHLQGPAAAPAAAALLRRSAARPSWSSAIALVHSRFSTNTFPTWDLAQPFRYIAHNGEINTLRGNRNWMQARREPAPVARSSAAASSGSSRSSSRARATRRSSTTWSSCSYLGGRTLPHAMMMMIPEAWEGNAAMDDERRAFYEYAVVAGRAVGRPGGDRLHRRPAHRRHARPQRPAPRALPRSPRTTA